LGFDQINTVDLGASWCPHIVVVLSLVKHGSYCPTELRRQLMAKNWEMEFLSAIEEAHATDR
jgi:hypothetical protein